jgi:type II secretion system protein I
MKSSGFRRMAGFTLIEVAVALTILGWVMGSALYLVQQYADERVRLREQFYSAQVSWNRLAENYQDSEGWTERGGRSIRSIKGIDSQGSQKWKWELEVKEAMGSDLYRYQVAVGLSGAERNRAALFVYLIVKN